MEGLLFLVAASRGWQGSVSVKVSVKAAVAGLVVAIVPTAAHAVGVSSSDGSGDQHITSIGNTSWASTGSLRSTSGNNVYFAGLLVYNFYTDHDCGRYTPNTSSSAYVTRGGTCAQYPNIPPDPDAAKYKVCRDRTGLPDGCGSWSQREDP
jgi:hypothetical protein